MLGKASVFRTVVGAMALLAAIGLPAPAGAAPGAKVDYDHIIDLAGQQRMITERISKETILLAMGVKRDERRKQLKELYTTFERTFKGLRDGDDGLRLPGTENPEILEGMSRVGELWTVYGSALQDALNGAELSRANVAIIADLSGPLLEATSRTVQGFKKEANTTGLFSILSVAIEISGRQRMLSQKMAKEFLLIAFGHEADKNRENLRKTMALFEDSLNWLLDGNAEQQVLPAPTPEIRGQLRRVQEHWYEFRPMVSGALDGAEITSELIDRVSSKSMSLLEEADAAVELYGAL